MSEQRYFGWKPSLPDHRDIYYTAPRTLMAALPTRVNLSEGWDNGVWNPVWNQSSLGSCGPHTACADVVYAALRQQSLNFCPMPSRLFVYYATRMLMGTINQDSGVTNRDLLKALAQYGWCDESMWPYDISKFRQQPPQECFKQAKTRKIADYLAVKQDLLEMKACLAGGDPFIFGFSVYQSIESAESSGHIPYPQRHERQLGGHDILITGYDDSAQRFFLRNSWGNSWGQGGMGTISYQYATNPNLAGDFWTVRHSALPDIAPEPPPKPPEPPLPPSPHKGSILLEVDWAFRKVEVASVV
jgi:hypothetical protein